MMRRVILIPLVLLSACSQPFGLVREGEFDQLLDYRCVEKSLRSLSTIVEVGYKYGEAGNSLSLSKKKSEKVHYFFYKTPVLNGYVLLRTIKDKKSVVSQSYTLMNKAPQQEEIDKVRPLMIEIKKSINLTCGIRDAESLFKETCTGVRCVSVDDL